MTLVDANVLIDVIEDVPIWSRWSEEQLLQTQARGPLWINTVVYGEIARDFGTQREVDAFLADLRIALEPLDAEIAFHAARAHARYRATGGQRLATLPDFFIGAHASVRRHRLLTRDSRRIRTYFPDVDLICPNE